MGRGDDGHVLAHAREAVEGPSGNHVVHGTGHVAVGPLIVALLIEHPCHALQRGVGLVVALLVDNGRTHHAQHGAVVVAQPLVGVAHGEPEHGVVLHQQGVPALKLPQVLQRLAILAAAFHDFGLVGAIVQRVVPVDPAHTVAIALELAVAGRNLVGSRELLRYRVVDRVVQIVVIGAVAGVAAAPHAAQHLQGIVEAAHALEAVGLVHESRGKRVGRGKAAGQLHAHAGIVQGRVDPVLAVAVKQVVGHDKTHAGLWSGIEGLTVARDAALDLGVEAAAAVDKGVELCKQCRLGRRARRGTCRETGEQGHGGDAHAPPQHLCHNMLATAFHAFSLLYTR